MMGRENKFRAWDCIEEKMIYPDNLDYDFEIYLDGSFSIAQDCVKEGLRRWWSRKSADFILEQYTGLKDKNGKEIYEGDIGETYSAGFLGFNRSPQGIVIFEDGRYIINECQWGNIGTPWGAVTIIGNIHENPDLIK